MRTLLSKTVSQKQWCPVRLLPPAVPKPWVKSGLNSPTCLGCAKPQVMHPPWWEHSSRSRGPSPQEQALGREPQRAEDSWGRES